jgi:phosphoribosyl-ATP pyrophosphohydrolase
MSFAKAITDLQTVIKARKDADKDSSYVAKMFDRGRKKIAQKVGEEAVEVAIAAVDKDKKEVITESADLLFHLLLLWEKMGIDADDIGKELQSRSGISGIEEKKTRKG